jgi:hypothetical protein
VFGFGITEDEVLPELRKGGMITPLRDINALRPGSSATILSRRLMFVTLPHLARPDEIDRTSNDLTLPSHRRRSSPWRLRANSE